MTDQTHEISRSVSGQPADELPAPRNDLGYWIEGLLASAVTDVTDQVLGYLCPLDLRAYGRRLKHVKKLWEAKTALRGAKKKEWEGKRSRLIGKAFERLLRTFFENPRAFSGVQTVRTTTAEIDLLVSLSPAAQKIVLFSGLLHFLGEAKCHRRAPKSEWVNEFRGILDTHQTRLGILFVHCTQRTLASDIRVAIALNAAQGYFIVPFGVKQFSEVEAGRPFLAVLNEQAIAARTHTTALSV